MENVKELLMRSFDQELTPQEKEALERALESSEELRQEKDDIEKMRKLISLSSPSFSDSFIENTMNRVKNEQDENPQLSQFISIFKRIAISGAAAIVALLISIYFIDGSLATDAIFGIADYSPEIAEFSLFDIQEIE